MKKKLLITLGIIIIVVLGILYSFTDVKESYYDTESTTATQMGYLVKDKKVRLTFTADKNNLGSISLMIGTSSRQNLTTMDVQILDEEQQIVTQQNIDLTSVTDNAYYQISFNKYVNSQNKTFTVLLSSPDATDDNAVVLYTYQKQGDSTHLFVDDKEQDYALAFRATYYNNFDLATFIVILYFITVIVFFVIFIYKFL